MDNKKTSRVVGWTIAKPVPLSDVKLEYWRSLDSWELGEAIFLLQGYEVDQTHESVLNAAMRTHPEFYGRVYRAFLVNEIPHPEKTPAGNPCLYAKTADWIKCALPKPGLLDDRWLDASADELKSKQKCSEQDRELYGEALGAYMELMDADPGATYERILADLKSKPVRWRATADYLRQYEAKSWEKAVSRAGGIIQLRAKARRSRMG